MVYYEDKLPNGGPNWDLINARQALDLQKGRMERIRAQMEPLANESEIVQTRILELERKIARLEHTYTPQIDDPNEDYRNN